MKTYEKIYQLLAETPDFVSGEKLAQSLTISRTAVWKAIQQLEARGLTIESVKHLGYRLVAGDLLLPDLISQSQPFSVHYQEESASTQLDAKQAIETGAKPNTLYLAPGQTAAKGRFGRQFFASQQGGIYMSLHLAPQLTYDQVPPYTLLVAASIVTAIHNLTDKRVQIKWVNDIYLGQKKIAGILTEAISSVETGTVTDMIIGVGINFHIIDFPDDIREKATSLFTDDLPSISRNQLIAEIWRVFHETPRDQLLAIYREQSLVIGKTVSFVYQQEKMTGQALDIDQDGRLLVQVTEQNTIWLNSGEVSLTDW